MSVNVERIVKPALKNRAITKYEERRRKTKYPISAEITKIASIVARVFKNEKSINFLFASIKIFSIVEDSDIKK